MFGAIAKAFREMKATTPEIRDLAKRAADHYEKLVGTGPALEKALAALAEAAELGRTKVAA